MLQTGSQKKIKAVSSNKFWQRIEPPHFLTEIVYEQLFVS